MTDERDHPTADDPTATEPAAGQLEGSRHPEGPPLRATPPPTSGDPDIDEPTAYSTIISRELAGEPTRDDTPPPPGAGDTDTTVSTPSGGVAGGAAGIEGLTGNASSTGRSDTTTPAPNSETTGETTSAEPLTGHPSTTSHPDTTTPAPNSEAARETTTAEGPTGHLSTTGRSDTTVWAPSVGTVSEAASAYGPTTYTPITGSESSGETTVPHIASLAGVDEITAAARHATSLPDAEDFTAAVGVDEPTTTGPTVGGWPFDEFEAPPPEGPVRRVEEPPPATAGHSPAYYVSLGATVVLVVGLVALAAVVAVMRPQREVAGSASAWPVLPETTATTSSQPPAPTTTSQTGPFATIAAHPLSSATTRMGDMTCALPRFDPADDRQATFYAAAKVCADVAWRDVLRQAGFDDITVAVVTVTGATQAGSCGELAPTSAATQCDGTVYLTPAHLRDTEQNGRFPGRYLGVFLREYASALQYATGLADLVGTVSTGPAEDLDTRLAQQATCLAGVAAGAMAGRGAVDSNITGEIRARLSTVDAPPDAQAWLDKGFQQRTPAACNTWV